MSWSVLTRWWKIFEKCFLTLQEEVTTAQVKKDEWLLNSLLQHMMCCVLNMSWKEFSAVAGPMCQFLHSKCLWLKDLLSVPWWWSEYLCSSQRGCANTLSVQSCWVLEVVQCPVHSCTNTRVEISVPMGCCEPAAEVAALQSDITKRAVT